jgi:thiamine-phosphate pyrophosphorylase
MAEVVGHRVLDPEKLRLDYRLYLVTDRDLMSTDTLAEAVEQGIRGGVTLVQLREKHASSRDFLAQALTCKHLCDAAGVPLIINDRLDIALASGAAGVHVGQDDLPVEVVRGVMGSAAIVGVSVATVAEAVAAEQGGADYLGVGAMCATNTKGDARLVTHGELLRIRAAVRIPLVVIGGVGERTIPTFEHTGIDGVAVVSAIIAQTNIEIAAARLLQQFDGLDRTLR